MRIWLLSALLSCFMLAPCMAVARADGEQQAKPPPIVVEGVEGMAAIITDVPTADEEAVTNAKFRAVEQAVGLYVQEEALVEQAILVDQFVRTRAQGYVESFVITKQPWTDADQIRHVVITASVAPQLPGDILKDVVSEESIAVLLPEYIDGEEQQEGLITNDVITALVEQEYRVKDVSQLLAIKERDSALRAEPEVSAKIGLRFLTNVIVTGRVEASLVSSGPFGYSYTRYTYRATATIRAVKADTGDIIFNKQIRGRNSAGLDQLAAAQAALENITEPLTDYMLRQMSSLFEETAREITVEVLDLASSDAHARFKNFLSSVRWVQEVEAEEYSSERSIFTCKYAPKTILLASRMDRPNEYKLLEYSRNRIVVRALAPPEAPSGGVTPALPPPQAPGGGGAAAPPQPEAPSGDVNAHPGG